MVNKAPCMDGAYSVFGKVTGGMDVARKIFQQPICRDDQDPEEDDHPAKPVVIRKVTIQKKPCGFCCGGKNTLKEG